jgi:hypothetical protein
MFYFGLYLTLVGNIQPKGLLEKIFAYERARSFLTCIFFTSPQKYGGEEWGEAKRIDVLCQIGISIINWVYFQCLLPLYMRCFYDSFLQYTEVVSRSLPFSAPASPEGFIHQ